MTKAERIFNDTYTECRQIVKHFGYETYSRLNNLVMKDTECGCTRTFNAIAKLIASERRFIVLSRKLNVINDERAEMLTNALNMVENTLNKAIEIQKEIDL